MLQLSQHLAAPVAQFQNISLYVVTISGRQYTEKIFFHFNSIDAGHAGSNHLIKYKNRTLCKVGAGKAVAACKSLHPVISSLEMNKGILLVFTQFYLVARSA